MTVLVLNPMKQFTRQLMQMMQAFCEESDSCGVILAKCSNVSPKFLVQLQTFLRNNEPELSVECYFDSQSRILGVVLDNRRLASTHYTSLVCKEFLEHHSLIDGQIYVASFPESGEPTEQTLLQLLHAVAQDERDSREINLFMVRQEKQGISSILVADTEEVSREFIKLRLELKGYEVYEAKDGSEALEKFTQFSPDLVITELNLPILDGYQLIHKIKEEHDSGGKVIVLTDKHLTKNMSRAFELGVSDYVTKPFSITELEWRIRKLQLS